MLMGPPGMMSRFGSSPIEASSLAVARAAMTPATSKAMLQSQGGGTLTSSRRVVIAVAAGPTVAPAGTCSAPPIATAPETSPSTYASPATLPIAGGMTTSGPALRKVFLTSRSALVLIPPRPAA